MYNACSSWYWVRERFIGKPGLCYRWLAARRGHCRWCYLHTPNVWIHIWTCLAGKSIVRCGFSPLEMTKCPTRILALLLPSLSSSSFCSYSLPRSTFALLAPHQPFSSCAVILPHLRLTAIAHTEAQTKRKGTHKGIPGRQRQITRVTSNSWRSQRNAQNLNRRMTELTRSCKLRRTHSCGATYTMMCPLVLASRIVY